jgi:ribosomal protein S18 acetylase RimI-like enzyme
MKKKISINDTHITISLFKYRDAHLFANLRRDIDRESDHLLAKHGERVENALHVIAKLLISQRRVVTHLAFDGKNAVGYVSLIFPKFYKLRGNAYLTIGIREKWRGKGIGNMLMETAEEYAKNKGSRRVELEVFGRNVNAIGLYTKRGYVIEGVKKEAVEDVSGYDDIIIMTKKIA